MSEATAKPWHLDRNVAVQPVVRDSGGLPLGARNRVAAEESLAAVNASDAAQALAEAVEARRVHQRQLTAPSDVWIAQRDALTEIINTALAAYSAARDGEGAPDG